MDIGKQEPAKRVELPAREAPVVSPLRPPIPRTEPVETPTPTEPVKVPAGPEKE